MQNLLSELGARVREYMRGCLAGEGGEAQFNALAVELHEAQRRCNGAYARWCGRRGAGGVADWREIPAVPTEAFKVMEMTSLLVKQRERVFFSSGTTGQERSRHFHAAESLALYEASALGWFQAVVRPSASDARWLFLTPKGEDAPHSSLAHMFQLFAERLAPGRSEFIGRATAEGVWELDGAQAVEWLERAAVEGRPVVLMGTAFLFVHLLDHLAGRGGGVALPPGSWALETGGYKGRSRVVEKGELHRLMAARLGIPSGGILSEYGMSELSSQGYDRADGVFQFPGWARVRIVSPETGREVAEGERGLIRVHDLANVWSVAAVQTQDMGVRRGGGFELAGRAAAAEPRGCSLLAV